MRSSSAGLFPARPRGLRNPHTFSSISRRISRGPLSVAVNLGRGYPRYNVGEFSGHDMLLRGEVDACVLVGSQGIRRFEPDAVAALLRVPTIVLDRPDVLAPFVPTVRFTTPVPGCIWRGRRIGWMRYRSRCGRVAGEVSERCGGVAGNPGADKGESVNEYGAGWHAHHSNPSRLYYLRIRTSGCSRAPSS